MVIFGCAVSAAKFQAEDDGYFKSEQFVSTGSDCEDENEKKIIQALENSAYIEDNGDLLTFGNAEDQVTLVLKKTTN